MLPRTAIAIVAAGAALTGGCADLMQRSTIAPEWFQAKAIEVKGEGYPELAEIPAAQGVADSQASWEAEAAALKAEAAQIEASAPDEPVPTDEELRAKAAQLRALVEKGRAAADNVEP